MANFITGFLALGTGAGANFIEIAGASGYARQPITFGTFENQYCKNSVGASFSATGTWPTATQIAVYDSRGILLLNFDRSSFALASGQSHTIQVGAITLNLPNATGATFGSAGQTWAPGTVIGANHAGQPIYSGANDYASNGSLTANAAAIYGQRKAQLRNRLTKAPSSGVAVFAAAVTTTTYLAVIPIEAPCYAVRLGFANPFNVAMTMTKCSVYPSDSYSVLTTNNNAGLTDSVHSTQYTVVPTGGAPGSPAYFDNAGADLPTINTAGTTRGYTLPAVSANSGNNPLAFTIQWSDFVPCTSIPRADGGVQHLLFVYVTINTTTGYSRAQGGLNNFAVTNADPIAHRGRYLWSGIAWNGGTDYADNPTGTGFKAWPLAPLFCLQYLTHAPGIQVVTNGDSLPAAPTNDNYSAPILRAACDISTPAMPIEVASMCWGGTASPIWEPMLRNNMAAIRPSIAALSPSSRNDGATVAFMGQLMAKCCAMADTMSANYGTKLIWNNAGCEPSYDGNNTAIAAWNAVQSYIIASATQAGVPHINIPSVVGQSPNSWDYITTPAVSDDNTHINFVGAELGVPLAKAALLALL